MAHPELCFPLSFKETHGYLGGKWSYHIIDGNGRKIGQLSNVTDHDFDLIKLMLSQPEIIQYGVDWLKTKRGWTETTDQELPHAD